MNEQPFQRDQWVCNFCYPDCVEIGEIAPGHWLAWIRDNSKITDQHGNPIGRPDFSQGRYCILGGQGHRDDFDVIYNIKPTPKMTDDEFDDSPNSLLDWHRWAQGIPELKMDPLQGYRFVLECIEGGYDVKEDGDLNCWLYNKAGVLIRDYESKNGPIEQAAENQKTARTTMEG